LRLLLLGYQDIDAKYNDCHTVDPNQYSFQALRLHLLDFQLHLFLNQFVCRFYEVQMKDTLEKRYPFLHICQT